MKAYSLLLLSLLFTGTLYAQSPEPKSIDVYTLLSGKLFSTKTQEIYSKPEEVVTNFTLSRDNKYLVFESNIGDQSTLWIEELATRKRTEAGVGLPLHLMIKTANKGELLPGNAQFTHGAFWTKDNRLVVTAGGEKGPDPDFLLAMDGTLTGDI